MQFNEFQRRLNRCHLDEPTKYLLTHMFEVQVELNKQLDTAAELILNLANTVGNVVELHADTQAKLLALKRGSMHDGVEVQSVRNDPEEDGRG